MKINVLKKADREIILEFETSDMTIPNLITDVLLKDKDVVFAGISKEHLEIGNPKLILKTQRKKAGEVLSKTLKSLTDEFSSIKSSIK